MGMKTGFRINGTVCARILFLSAALLMIGAGLYRNEAATVWNKGINICLECVGIG